MLGSSRQRVCKKQKLTKFHRIMLYLDCNEMTCTLGGFERGPVGTVLCDSAGGLGLAIAGIICAHVPFFVWFTVGIAAGCAAADYID